MNQTKKRLAIIELAISITDIEAIRLQLLRLQPLRSDEKIHEILSLLEDENYAQAQALIASYIQTPTQTVIQRIPEEEQAIIDEFDFLEVKPDTIDEENNEETDIVKEETQEQPKIEEIKSSVTKEEVYEEKINDVSLDNEANETTNFDTLLNMNAEDIMSENIKIDVAVPPKTDYIKEKIDFNLDTVPKDSFFDTIESTINQETKEIESVDKEQVKEENLNIAIEKEIGIETDNEYHKEEDHTIASQNEKSEIRKVEEKEETLAEIVKDIETPQFEEDREKNVDEIIITPKPKAPIENTSYDAMSYIHHKLQDLQQAYPPVHETNEPYSEELEAWLEIISEKGYTEADVEEVLKHIEKLAHSDKAQAALFLLATSATKSQYAQFILARALYRGTLLQRNLDESFRIMSQLAFRDKYPEAICDLAQFYENGIAVDKDKAEAKALYKEAMELGIQRAVNHYARLMKEPKGLFSFFKK